MTTDTTPPTAPSGLAGTVTGSTVALTWSAASDNVAVVRYNLHRSTTSGFTPDDCEPDRAADRAQPQRHRPRNRQLLLQGHRRGRRRQHQCCLQPGGRDRRRRHPAQRARHPHRHRRRHQHQPQLGRRHRHRRCRPLQPPPRQHERLHPQHGQPDRATDRAQPLRHQPRPRHLLLQGNRRRRRRQHRPRLQHRLGHRHRHHPAHHPHPQRHRRRRPSQPKLDRRYRQRRRPPLQPPPLHHQRLHPQHRQPDRPTHRAQPHRQRSQRRHLLLQAHRRRRRRQPQPRLQPSQRHRHRRRPHRPGRRLRLRRRQRHHHSRPIRERKRRHAHQHRLGRCGRGPVRQRLVLQRVELVRPRQRREHTRPDERDDRGGVGAAEHCCWLADGRVEGEPRLLRLGAVWQQRVRPARRPHRQRGRPRHPGPGLAPDQHLEPPRRHLRRDGARALSGRHPGRATAHQRPDGHQQPTTQDRRQRDLGRMVQRPHRRSPHLQPRFDRDPDPGGHECVDQLAGYDGADGAGVVGGDGRGELGAVELDGGERRGRGGALQRAPGHDGWFHAEPGEPDRAADRLELHGHGRGRQLLLPGHGRGRGRQRRPGLERGERGGR